MIERDTVGALVDEFINCGLNLIVETKDKDYLSFADRLVSLGLPVTLLSKDVLMHNGVNCITDVGTVPVGDVLLIDKGMLTPALLDKVLVGVPSKLIIFTSNGVEDLKDCMLLGGVTEVDAYDKIASSFDFLLEIECGTVTGVMHPYPDYSFRYILAYKPDIDGYVCLDTPCYDTLKKLRRSCEFQKLFNIIWFN